MRRAGAAARVMLESAAAAQWQVPVSEVEAKNHEVVHKPTGRKLGYGTLAKAAAKQPVPARETLRLKDPSQFRYIGKGQLKLVDGRDIATGKAQYGIDTRLDGMLYAVVARPPVYGGKVASFDAAEAMKVPGVMKVVVIEGSPAPPGVQSAGRAVIGRNTWAAMQDASQDHVDDGPNASRDSVAFKASLEERLQAGPCCPQRRRSRRRRASAAKRLSAEYYILTCARDDGAGSRANRRENEIWGPSSHRRQRGTWRRST
jgi:isoquinoline 1-oxidoreductase beta subunit